MTISTLLSRVVYAVALTAVVSVTVQAQATTKIGATSGGIPVMLETKSVSRANGIITATLRVAVQPAIKTQEGDMVLLRTTNMYDCAKQTSAMKERWFFFDAKGTKQARHDKPGKPGFAGAIKGSLADVGLQHFCKAGAK